MKNQQQKVIITKMIYPDIDPRTQPAIKSSKLTIETLEQGVKCAQS